jgi:hypothetical protein
MVMQGAGRTPPTAILASSRAGEIESLFLGSSLLMMHRDSREYAYF